MTDTKEMIDAVPGGVPLPADAVAAAIDDSLSCLQSCTTCANADLAEDDVGGMRECIASCLTCADVCDATARLLSRPAYADLDIIHLVLQACVRSCTACAEECARHAPHHVHCALCEQVCRTGAESCAALLGAEAFAALQ